MRTLPAALTTHLAEDVTTLALCWMVTRTDGVVIRGTSHDRDITIATESPLNPRSGTYLTRANISGSQVRSTSDLSVDNLEVSGALPDDLTLVDLTATDIEAGLLDDAEVRLFVVNWQSPDDGQIILRAGNIGNIRRTENGDYTAELRGLAQRLSQNVLRTYSAQCGADLGDTRCGVSLTPYTVACTVTAVTSRRRFDVTMGDSSPISSPLPAATYYNGGRVLFTSGNNNGYSMEVKRDAAGGTVGELELYMEMPADVEVGDTLELRPGCDKSLATCRDTFNNVVNFRGWGVLVPLQNEVLKPGGQ